MKKETQQQTLAELVKELYGRKTESGSDYYNDDDDEYNDDDADCYCE